MPYVSTEALLRLLRNNALPQLGFTDWAVNAVHHRVYGGIVRSAVECDEIWTQICAAVRDCTSLRTVRIDPRVAYFKRHYAPQALELLSALRGNPSVKHVVTGDVEYDDLGYRQNVATSFGEIDEMATGLAILLAANVPALQRLSLCDLGLDAWGLALVLRALPRNTHLKELALWLEAAQDPPDDPAMSDPTTSGTCFLASELFTAVQQNRSLRELTIDPYEYDEHELDSGWEELHIFEAAVTHVRDRSDPAVQAAARGWQRAYRKWTAPRALP